MAQVIEGLRRFTVEEYHRMAEAGVFGPEERVELIRGVIRQMSPKGRNHNIAVSKGGRLFNRHLGDRAGVHVQNSLMIPGWHSEPEPDIQVTASQDLDLVGTGADCVLLLVEVADSSLAYDRTEKAALYAEAGIPEYWIVNLIDGALEVHRKPVENVYRERMKLEPGTRVSPISWPELEIDIADLLPRK